MSDFPRLSLIRILAAAAAIAAFPAFAATNLVTDGDFEQGATGALGTAGVTTAWTSAMSTGNVIAGPDADVALLWGPQSMVNNGFTASSQFLAIGDATSGGQVSQVITGLTPGASYTLSLDWAAAQDRQFSGATMSSVVVALDNAYQPATTAFLPSQGFSGWMSATFSFTAAATTQTLALSMKTPPVPTGAMVLVDNVSLTADPVVPPPVPEPASVALMLAGGVVVAGAARRRQRRG